MLQNYKWSVTYDDGQVIHEDEAKGWKSVDEQRVRNIRLSTNAPRSVYFETAVHEGEIPQFFRRYRQDVNPETGEAAKEELCALCIGVLREDGPDSLLYIFADGRIALTDADID